MPMTKPGDTLMNAAAALSIRVIHRSLNGGGWIAMARYPEFASIKPATLRNPDGIDRSD